MDAKHLVAAALVVAGALLQGAPAGGNAMAFTLRSPAFEHGATIPREHTCDGADRSPQLAWSDPPPGTKSFALVADDPDAPVGTWVHWVVYDLAAKARELPTGVPPRDEIEGGGRQGVNDFRRVGYGGPCPPPGPAHRYYFKLYALDAPTGLPARATKAALLKAIRGHVLAEAQLMGRYQRGR